MPIAAGALIVAAIGAVAVVVHSGGDGATTQGVVATLHMPGPPNAIAAAPDAVWAGLEPSGANGSRLVRVNPVTGATERSVSVDGALTGFAVHAGRGLWVGHNGDAQDTTAGALEQLDWVTGAALGTVQFDRPVFGITTDDHSIWAVVGRSPATLVRVDPTSARVVGTPVVISPHRVIGIAYGLGAIYATDFEDGTLIQVDRASGHVATLRLGGSPVGVVVAGGLVWVADRAHGTVMRVDPATMEAFGPPLSAGSLPTWLAAADGSVWVSNQADGTVVRLDAKTGAQVGSPIRIADPTPEGNPPAAHALADGGDALWAASMSEQTVSRIDPSQ
jgi:DNA-binding beta-propeller fold protein YncE